tara:strand:+ start:89 stop:406 length:318 start_codon:yes stop_codon:yes gene_type:complete
MTILKRNRETTKSELVKAIDSLCELLGDQNEEEAVEALQEASAALNKTSKDDAAYKDAIQEIIDAFEGEHELIAYTHQREGEQWTEVEELSHQSSRVLSLARRLR